MSKELKKYEVHIDWRGDFKAGKFISVEATNSYEAREKAEKHSVSNEDVWELNVDDVEFEVKEQEPLPHIQV
jgi:hypothetical protein